MSTQIIEQEKQETQVQNFDNWIDARQHFIGKVNEIVVEGKDYHIIKGKKSLAKGGAEKVASIFQWVATFQKDTEALEMLGGEKGLVCFVCTLTKNDKVIGQGRGAASLKSNANDPNKTLKMAQKSAYIDAVIRASGLSDIFTQDLEDMSEDTIHEPQTNNYAYREAKKPTDKQLQFLHTLATRHGLTDADKKILAEKWELTLSKDMSQADASAWIEKLVNTDQNVIDELLGKEPTFDNLKTIDVSDEDIAEIDKANQAEVEDAGSR